MHHPTRLLVYGFAIVILMMVTLAFIAFYATSDTNGNVNQQVSQQLEKINLINELSTIIQHRTRFMQSMLLHDEEFIEAESWPNFNRLEGAYTETRTRLLPLLAPREREIMEAIDRLDRDINDLNRQVSVLFLNGSRDEASKILLREVLPKTAPLLSHLSELTQAQRMDVQKALLMASSDTEKSRTQIVIFSIIAVLISLAVTCIAIWYGRKLSGQLQNMNDYLEQKIYERTESLLDTQKELLEDNNELTRMALTDSLTGLSNRTSMNQILHKEFARFERHDQRFGIIMLDIDKFKNINDSYGHDTGDKVLRQLATIFENAIRASDFVARWGGEEFLICCTTIEEVDLLPIAETIRKLVASTTFETAGQITASLGCAAIVKGESIGELIKRSDVALYEAKNNGRNQTVVSEFTDISLIQDPDDNLDTDSHDI
ncbi:MAG: GGDEF domain-containing protein [Gammaproteobacteria bacterium]|nr:GGDEF domain-containing protein [Gammaproteobacteria bacterium]